MLIPTTLLLLLPFLPLTLSARGGRTPPHHFPSAQEDRLSDRLADPIAALALAEAYYAPLAARATGGVGAAKARATGGARKDRRAAGEAVGKIKAERGEREGQRRVRKRKTCITKPSTSSSSSLTPTTTTSSSSTVVATSSIPSNVAVVTSLPATTSSTRTTSSTAAATTTASSFTTVDPSGVGPYSGQSTYYVLGSDGSSVGACGTSLVDTDYIAAASQLLYDTWPGATANPNTNPICGQRARVTYNGKSVTVRIADRCESCAKRDLDLSEVAFAELAAFSVGRMSMTWEWVA